MLGLSLGLRLSVIFGLSDALQLLRPPSQLPAETLLFLVLLLSPLMPSCLFLDLSCLLLSSCLLQSRASIDSIPIPGFLNISTPYILPAGFLRDQGMPISTSP
ncbi:hypothetical protein BJX99DRAFT_186967 [Aspergillus californicus]